LIAGILRKGGVVIFPTETLYGLFCDATNPRAVAKIFKIKDRPAGKAFPILVKDFSMLRKFAVFGEAEEKKLRKIWPRKMISSSRGKSTKPTTVVLPARNLPEETIVRGSPSRGSGRPTAAFRISPHPLVKKLFQHFRKPLVATSANLSGQPPIQDSRKYKEVFGERVKLINDFVFAGINRKKKGSRIVKIQNGRIISLRK
jgi:L-threonylcarbamoyladenylate synthase